MKNKLHQLSAKLTSSSSPARLWTPLENGRVQCHLSPRQCNIPSGGLGYCGVRYNDNGTLVTLNYGKSVAVTQETIETEAVFHYAPGEAILSLGNIGCMMKCDFCHNWQTSQARLARNEDIHHYTPEQIVEYALKHNIRVLSWTYNDPVVWQEFVVDTARLAKSKELKNLYKSAFYINPIAIEELLEVIDIFSISLKSMDEEFYRRHTQGKLQPVLDGIKQVYQARKSNADGPHLEISNLCVTGRNDNLTESRKVAQWILENLDIDIPLHYVRFHPDYEYTHVERTSIPFLEEARKLAIDMGLRYVYLGNVYDSDSVNTYCPDCGTVCVERYGLMATSHLKGNNCPNCNATIPITHLDAYNPKAANATLNLATLSQTTHYFHGAMQALHVEQHQEAPVYFQFINAENIAIGKLHNSSCKRFMIAKAHPDAVGVRLYFAPEQSPQLLEVADRAHFPVSATTIEDGHAN